MTMEATHHSPRFGTDPALSFVTRAAFLAILNAVAFSTMNGWLVALAVVVDVGMVLPLLGDMFAAVAYRAGRTSLRRSGLEVDEVVPGRAGRFLAFDTAAGKVFVDGRVRDIDAIRTAQWIREGRQVYVEITFGDGLGAMTRLPVRDDYEGAEAVAAICRLADLSFD